MINQTGQSLIELLIALAIFVMIISAVSVFLIDGYLSNLWAYQNSLAIFLAEEGLEAIRSIRDSNWEDLIVGSHGLTISGGRWVLQGTQEDISSDLKEGTRRINIEDIAPDTKKITSQINWQLINEKPTEIKLVSYLTNWQKGIAIEIRRPTTHKDFGNQTIKEKNAYDYQNGTTFSSTDYNISKDPSITFYDWEIPTQIYTALVLKYRYHADQAVDDMYAIAYSTTGCQGLFTDLISPTSGGISDTTLSATLSVDQDLSQLCLKIYSILIGKADKKIQLYTRDIWTEGSY